MKTYIKVPFEFEGIHNYPDAPEGVKFLRNKHRHLFKCSVQIEVFNDDREIEFILFKRWLSFLYESKVLDAGDKSCEMLAKDILRKVRDKYGVVEQPKGGYCMWTKVRDIIVEVSEDGENSAIVIL